MDDIWAPFHQAKHCTEVGGVSNNAREGRRAGPQIDPEHVDTLFDQALGYAIADEAAGPGYQYWIDLPLLCPMKLSDKPTTASNHIHLH
jgi:hypothetical protein